MKGRMDMDNLTYTRVGDYLVPDLAMPPQPEGNLGKYGRARLAYLKEHKSLLHMHLLSQGTLWEHLLGIQGTAAERMDLITAQMAKAQGVDEALKASNQMLWVGRMNNIRQAAEESVMRELVYS